MPNPTPAGASSCSCARPSDSDATPICLSYLGRYARSCVRSLNGAGRCLSQTSEGWRRWCGRRLPAPMHGRGGWDDLLRCRCRGTAARAPLGADDARGTGADRMTERHDIDDVLARARAGLHRLEPTEAYEAVRAGAVLVDIRPEASRALEGDLPGAVVIDRNVLEWRLDPTSDAHLPIASYDLRAIVVCNEGYASSL